MSRPHDPTGPTDPLSGPADPDPTVPTVSWLYRSCAWLAFAVFRLQRWRYDRQGMEHVPRTGGAVIAANHTSFWDFFTVGMGPYLAWGRPLRILAKDSLFRKPVFGWAMREAEHIPVHRGSGATALRTAVARLQAGEMVLVLPEQTVSPSFELLPFKSGAVRMAALAGVPLVPAASWGSHRFHTIGHRPRWSWKLPVVIRYGEPLHPTPDDDPAAVTVELQRRVQALLDDAQAAYPHGAPAGAAWVPARQGGGAPSAEEGDRILDRIRAGWKPKDAT
jgi:1-acyl-sn-glycerol-3-phosphate acyltransferase